MFWLTGRERGLDEQVSKVEHKQGHFESNFDMPLMIKPTMFHI